jgi:hypothetical protein
MNDRSMETDPEARAVLDDLVRAARADRPGSKAMQRAVVALGLGAATVAAAATATGSAAAAATAAVAGKSAGVGLSALSIVKAAAVGVAVGAVVLGTAASTGMLSRGPEAPTEAAAVSAGVAPEGHAHRPKSGTAEANRNEAIEQDHDEPAQANPALPAAGARPNAGSNRPAVASPVDGLQSPAGQARAPSGEATLADEVRMLEAAKSEISAGRPGVAVEILDRYRRSFPNGRLALEADVLRIESLFRTGRASTAIGLANKFLAANPQSTLAGRVRAMLQDAPGAPGAR